jgi:hypothetical protein
VYQTPYKGRIDRVAQLWIASKCTGYVDWVRLTNSRTGQVIFFDDFTHPAQNPTLSPL